MARPAQRHDVGRIKLEVGAVAQLDDVMDFGRCRQVAALVAVRAERCCLEDAEAEAPPCTIVSALVRRAAIALIALSYLCRRAMLGMVDGWPHGHWTAPGRASSDIVHI